MSPPVAVLVTLALILLMPRRVPMWVTFLGACLLLPLLCGNGFAGSARLAVEAAKDARNWTFVGQCAAVFVLSSILTHGGHLAAICDLATAFVPSRKVRAALMPAMVGLVPMPGGAIVSAPLIDRALGDSSVSGTDKNLINYWFRHIWEVSWPLYPSVFLAASWRSETTDPRFILAQACLTVVLAATGYVALLSRVPMATTAVAPPRPAAGRFRALLPLVVLIVVPLTTRWSGAFVGSVWGTALLAIVAALLTTIDVSGLRKVPFDRRIWSMTVLAYLIQVFGNLVEATGASAATSNALRAAGLPGWLPLVVLPFLVGFSTGGTLPFVTVAFPIVIPHLWAGVYPLEWLVLAYAGGFIGYLTSPVHMCFVLSTRYFNAKMLSAYARLAVPLLCFLAAAVGLFLVLGGRFSS